MARVMTLSQRTKSRAAHRAALKRRGVAYPPSSSSSVSEIAVDDDIECQVERGSPKSAPAGGGRLPLQLRHQAKRSSSSIAIGGGKNGTDAADDAAYTPTPRSVSIRVLLRKIAKAVLTDLDDDTLQRDDTETILVVITLLKKAMLGILIAFVFVSVVLFLDHIFALRLPTARNFRKASFAMMNDPDTLKSFEENAGLKFVDMDRYDSMLQEISQAENKTTMAQSILKGRSQDLAESTRELEKIQTETPRMIRRLGLNKFCDECLWDNKQTCAQRVVSLTENHNVKKHEAKMSAMMRRSCVKTPGQMEEGRKMDATLEAAEFMIAEWHSKYKEQYMPEGKWDGKATCALRADYLSGRHGYSADKAQAMTMVESEKCRNLFFDEENEEIARFCFTCMLDKGVTCGLRAGRLANQAGVTKRRAMLMTMKDKKACRGGETSKGVSRFCEECRFDEDMTCITHAKYLAYREGIDKEEARKVVMKKNRACTTMSEV